MKKWSGRLGEGLAYALAGFIIVSILNKLLFKSDDWLYRSLVTSVTWGVVIPIKYYFIIDKKYNLWAVITILMLTVIILSLFVTGVCLSLPNYWLHTGYITYAFLWPMFFVQVSQDYDKKKVLKENKNKFNGDIVV